MEKVDRLRPLALIQSGLFLLLLALLLTFEKGSSLIYGSTSLVLLIIYHFVIDYQFTAKRFVSSGLVNLYIGLYLLLCTFVVMTTTGNEESPFWIVYFLPIIIAAANLNIRGTMMICSAALLLFIISLPASMYLDVKERVEELPELIGFGVMFFLVGILVQTFVQQNRRQLLVQQKLNAKLMENQQHLKDSLNRLEAAEESLRTKERLASLGEMSAGIAHEIRNPLGIICSSAQLLDGEVADLDARQLLEIIQEESTRLNCLITEFLTFGRQIEPDRQLCDLVLLITRTIDSLQGPAALQGVRIDFDQQSDYSDAVVDADMIQQVLLNLLLNALEATPAGGRIEVVLQRHKNQFNIIVRDSGSGIPAEMLSKVFDPFFTTKSKGTGLGLANAYKLMESHGGSLRVASRPGGGATFTASLPLEIS